MPSPSACLVLADGTRFEGESIGALGTSVGELVFNTGMTGYQEMLSDPSYAEQIITLTTAHVGNTGCNLEDNESTKVWAKGLVIRDYVKTYSNYRANQSLHDWLKKNQVVGISGIDTRALTHRLRQYGAIAACITTEMANLESALERAQSFSGLAHLDLAQTVTRKKIETWPAESSNAQRANVHVVVYDYGVKHSILHALTKRGCQLTIVPAKTPVTDVLSMNPDGIVLSNGPGDPAACDYAIEAARIFVDKGLPLFGICLGFQILSLACGAKAVKMKYGHHGANHPVIEVRSPRRVYITSQNHGFAIDESSLPENLIATHHSLFDGSLQGIMHRDKPAFGFQGHPEAGPGPHDIEVLFDQFLVFMMEYKSCE